MADVSANLKDWSTTAASNAPTDSTSIGAGLADNFQEVQKVVRQDLAHKGADIASAGTTDLGAVAGLMHDITGTTTITSFGTVSAGIWKLVKFEGALTLTHNATSLILPNAANITTADGDTALAFSEGSGNWRIHSYAGKNAYHSTLTTSGAAAVGGNLVVSGTGRVDGILGGDGTDLSLGGSTATEQVRITHTASATRYITLTGSNGGNPVITVSGGGLSLQSASSATTLLLVGGDGNNALVITNPGSPNPYGFDLAFSAASPDNNTVHFAKFQDSTTNRCIIYSDGDLANHDGTYGTISDMRFKPSNTVTPARSQMADIRAIGQRAMINYETQFSPGKKLLGFDSDVLSEISPGCVHVSKWGDVEDAKWVDTMTVCVKGVKALAELIDKDEADDNYYRAEIAALQARVAQLEGRLP
jgi:hypothetical protein